MAAEPGVTVKIRGIRQLQSGMADLLDNIERAEPRDALLPTAEQAAQTIRARVPRKSGRLAASVRATLHGRRATVEMGAGLAYGNWIEYGTWGGRARPRGGRYVYPTAKRTTRALGKHAERVCSQEIRRMRWPTPR